MGQVLQEAPGQSGQILPAGEHAVPGPHQRTVERAGPEQLLPQQRCAGRFDPRTHARLLMLRWRRPRLTARKGGCFVSTGVDKAASLGNAGLFHQQLEGSPDQ